MAMNINQEGRNAVARQREELKTLFKRPNILSIGQEWIIINIFVDNIVDDFMGNKDEILKQFTDYIYNKGEYS